MSSSGRKRALTQKVIAISSVPERTDGGLKKGLQICGEGTRSRSRRTLVVGKNEMGNHKLNAKHKPTNSTASELHSHVFEFARKPFQTPFDEQQNPVNLSRQPNSHFDENSQNNPGPLVHIRRSAAAGRRPSTGLIPIGINPDVQRRRTPNLAQAFRSAGFNRPQ